METFSSFQDMSMIKLMIMGLFLLVFQLVFPAISGFMMIYAGMKMRGRNSLQFSVNGWLPLFFLLWGLAELLTLFMDYTAIRNVSDQMLTILALILMAPFLLGHARILGGVNHDKGIRQLEAFGLSFAMVAITISSGMLAAYFTGKHLEIGLMPSGALFLFLTGLYAAKLCFSIEEAPAPEPEIIYPEEDVPTDTDEPTPEI